MRRAYALVLICSAFLAACASGTTTARPVPTASASPTATPTIARQPVVLAVSATSQGTVVANNVLLDTKVAITSNTSTIAMAEDCIYKFAVLSLDDPTGTEVWHNYREGGTCPDPFLVGIQTIASGATYVWSETDDLSGVAPLHLQVNVSYTLKAYLAWYQGSTSRIGMPDGPQGTHIMGQTTITFV